ncbi:hypothetical protein ACP70R_001388 [Stipagrostis hirtigluma subsp. patula]
MRVVARIRARMAAAAAAAAASKVHVRLAASLAGRRLRDSTSGNLDKQHKGNAPLPPTRLLPLSLACPEPRGPPAPRLHRREPRQAAQG